MLLSGIKTGKRKRPISGTQGDASGLPVTTSSRSVAAAAAAAAATAGGFGGGVSNRNAAEALRLGLQGDGDGYSKHGTSDTIQSKNHAREPSSKINNDTTIQGLQSRGRISSTIIVSEPRDDDDDNKNTIVIHSDRNVLGNKQSTITYEHEHGIRYNSRGKLSRHAHDQLRQKTEQEMTIEEMAAQERHAACCTDGNDNNMDDTYARNILRMGKGFKKLDKVMGTKSHSGADEDDYLQDATSLHNLYRSNDDKLSPAKLASRSKSRQIAQHDALAKWTAKSWWWMESSSFDKKYLIALGERVSLVMTPSHKRLQQQRHQHTKTDGNGGDGGNGKVDSATLCR